MRFACGRGKEDEVVTDNYGRKGVGGVLPLLLFFIVWGVYVVCHAYLICKCYLLFLPRHVVLCIQLLLIALCGALM